MRGRKVGYGGVSLPEMERTLAELKSSSLLSFDRRFSYLKTRVDPLWTIDWDLKWMRMARPAMSWGMGQVTPRLIEANPQLQDGTLVLGETSWNAAFLQRTMISSTPSGDGYTGTGSLMTTFGDYFTLPYQRRFEMRTMTTPGYMAEDQNGERYWVTADEMGFRAGCASVSPQPAGVTIKWAPWKALWPAKIVQRRIEMAWASRDFSFQDASSPLDGEPTSQQPLALKGGFPSSISEEARADYEAGMIAARSRYRHGWGF